MEIWFGTFIVGEPAVKILRLPPLKNLRSLFNKSIGNDEFQLFVVLRRVK